VTGPRRHVAESLRKGHRVLVTGRLITRSWTDKNDQTGYRIEIADEIAPSLRWATATITKATRTNGKSPAVDPSNLSDDDIPFENCAAHSPRLIRIRFLECRRRSRGTIPSH
jgi:single-stranded DNA-binding protein